MVGDTLSHYVRSEYLLSFSKTFPQSRFFLQSLCVFFAIFNFITLKQANLAQSVNTTKYLLFIKQLVENSAISLSKGIPITQSQHLANQQTEFPSKLSAFQLDYSLQFSFSLNLKAGITLLKQTYNSFKCNP